MFDLNPIEISVTHADGQIPLGVPCRLCPDPILPGHAVVRFSDFAAGPGTREHVTHKSCMQLLLDATADDVDVVDARFQEFRQGLVEKYVHIEN